MSEFEEAAEVGRELIAEAAAGNGLGWISWTAISTLVMALFSAIGALLAGITANEAVMERTREIMEAVDRDRDQIEVEILQSRHELLTAMGKPPGDDERQLLEKKRAVREGTKELEHDEEAVETALVAHELFAIGVTLLSIGITLSGMAVVCRKPRIWHCGLAGGACGAGTVLWAVVRMLS